MDPKYSNIFWHQGVKIFAGEMFESKKGRVKISHLENDVTKALINLFQHYSRNVLREILRLIGVKQAPETFDYDFQVTDTEAYRNKNNRIMLAIIAANTPRRSYPAYSADRSVRDACIFNKDTVILIESKTQSPLIEEQLKSHIHHYLGTATKERIITWEEISEKLHMLKKGISSQDRFLIFQFTEFLELIGIAEFNGFSCDDFTMLGRIGRISDEDYLDFKRMLHKKIEKFMVLLDEDVGPNLDFKNYGWRTAKVNPKGPSIWSAFYFYDDDPDIHVNKYPNLNILFREHGMELSLNAEIQSSMKYVLKHLKKSGNDYDRFSNGLKKFDLSLFYKLQYLPMDNFVWNLIPGYPKPAAELKADQIISSIEKFEKDWPDIRDTLLFQMRAGLIKRSSGRVFNDKEIQFAEKKNNKPTYAFRIEKRYPAADIGTMEKKLVPFFKKEILKLKKITAFMLT
ncbi:hypothetical protein ACFL4N_04070 [Thermodesulfobacteriota bacterium]